MTNPLISIVVPSYNRAEFISETLDSVIKQTYPHWEVIFVDDGSTDDTAQILKHYQSLNSRIRYFYQNNAERALARTRGIELAQGEFVCLLDSDDIWYPNKLAKSLEIFKSNPDIVCVYSSVDRINLKSQKIQTAKRQQQGYSGNITAKLLERNCIPSLSPMLRIAIAKQALPQRTDLIPYEDWDYWLKVSRLGPFHYIQQPLGAYRLHPGQSIKNVQANRIQEITLKILDFHTRLMDLESKKPFYSLAYLRLAYWFLVSGNAQLSRLKLKIAYELNYKRILDYRFWGLLIISYCYDLNPNFFQKFLGSLH